MKKHCTKFKLIISIILSVFLISCLEQKLPKGVIATVNDEPIYLHSVQVLLDSRSPSFGYTDHPSLERMKYQYSDALSTLIIHALIRQELSQKNMEVKEEEIEKIVTSINDDFAPDGLPAYLTEQAIDISDWQQLMNNYLALKAFEKNILSTMIRISPEEIQKYYDENSKNFNIPETYKLCFLSSDKKENIEDACKSFSIDTILNNENIISKCTNISKENIDEQWKKSLSSLNPNICAQPKQQNKLWQTIAYTEKLPPKKLSITEAYPLIESVLIDIKKKEAFDLWLEQKLAKAKILVSPLLKAELLNPSLNKMLHTPIDVDDNNNEYDSSHQENHNQQNK